MPSAMLNTHLMKHLKSNDKKIPHDTRAKLVRLVMQEVQNPSAKPCNKCESTGKVILNSEYTECSTCKGGGSIYMSGRKVAKILSIPSSTYNDNYSSVYDELMSFCAILEGNCAKHFSYKEDL